MEPQSGELFRGFLDFVAADAGARARLRELLRDDALTQLTGTVAALRAATERGLLRLEEAVAQLAEAQRRTEERLEALAARVDQLAEAQRRTEERLEALATRVDQLAEAQRRTEERLEALAARVDQLAEAQRRAEERLEALAARVDQLAEAQAELVEQFGRLTADIGVTAEIEATEVLTELMERRRYTILTDPESILLDGEVDVAATVQDPEGRRLTVLIEVKNRLYPQDVARWAERVASEGFRRRLASSGLLGPYLVYAFGRRVYRGTADAAAERGIGLLTPRGEQVAPQLRDA